MNWWEKIKHFKPSEFDSPDQSGSGLENMKAELVIPLDKARRKSGFPYVVRSGYRTESHNKTVGGVPDSAHMDGLAADIECNNSRERSTMVKELHAAGFTRIGIGRDYIHVDASDLIPNVMWHYYKEPVRVRVAKALGLNTYVSRYYQSVGKDV